MIRGMTGFGKATVRFSLGRVSVELRSINHRYFDLVVHLPANFSLFENRVRKEIKKQIERGRVTFLLVVSRYNAPAVYLNRELAKYYLAQLQKLSKELRLKDSITLQQIAGFEGVLRLGDLGQPSEAFWQPINNATRLALNKLVRMRKAEGFSIYNDINNKLAQAGKLTTAISKRRQIVFQEKRRKLTSEEWRCFIKDRDINEEVTRLRFHLHSFKKQLHKSGAVGKELDFISQELQREINTIGAKLPDKKVTHCVIKIKSSIEQIREQLQNTE